MASDNKKRVPLGKPLPLTDKDLDEMSRVTPLDIEKTKAFWRASVSKKFRTLLDAEVIEDATDTNKPTK